MRARRGVAWLAALAFAAGAAAAQPLAPKLATTEVVVHGERLVVEVARTPSEQYRGLGGRTHIDPKGGMLFPFGAPRVTAFVMRDCPVPIDVAFLDAGGRVIAVHEMQPEPPRRTDESPVEYESRLRAYPSGLPAWFALETAGGRLRELGLRGGDTVQLDRAVTAPTP
jgi:uncharacterized membrane protein (UPF0127 family)